MSRACRKWADQTGHRLKHGQLARAARSRKTSASYTRRDLRHRGKPPRRTHHGRQNWKKPSHIWKRRTSDPLLKKLNTTWKLKFPWTVWWQETWALVKPKSPCALHSKLFKMANRLHSWSQQHCWRASTPKRLPNVLPASR